jgi:fructose-specific phosphotransferase system IIA component
MRISELLNKNAVQANLKSNTKEGIFTEIVDSLLTQKKIKEKNLILKSLLQREQQGSTGIGNGVAIPHARIEVLKDVVFFVGLSKRGIDFSSIDKKPVHVIFLFLTPLSETGTHLKILSKLSTMLHSKSFVQQLRNASTNEELYLTLTQSRLDQEGFVALNRDEIYLELGTSESGLSEEEAKRRLEDYGLNKLKAIKKRSLFISFISNLTNLLAILMWVGSGLAFLSGMPEICWAIIVVIFLNAVFSFWQEFKAEKAIDALKKLLPSYSRVVRNGEEKKALSEEIVPGDIIIVEEGDHIPADARLIEAQELRVNNSAFSGESKLSHKMSEGFHDGKEFLWLEMPNLIFAGTTVATGFSKAVVIATGMATEIGKIAYLTQTVKDELSPLQKEINRLTRMIAALAVVMGIVFFLVGAAFTGMTYVASAMFAIGIILANVPEGLMPTVTLALAMAVQRMAKRKALVKKLSSIETLGCTNVICTDKTGTITTNQMSVQKIWMNNRIVHVTGTGYDPQGKFTSSDTGAEMKPLGDSALSLLMKIGVLCNTAKLTPPSEARKFWDIIGDPTEGALLVLAQKAGFEHESERNKCPVLKRFPFESVRKRMSSIHTMPDGEAFAFVKGAPKELLEISSRIILNGQVQNLNDALKSQIMSRIDEFAHDGLRILGFAFRNLESKDVETASAQSVERDLTFVGVTAMFDPPRAEVNEAIATCKEAGIRVVMVTGDYPITALSIARKVGIISTDDAEVITGLELPEMTDEQLKERLQKKEVVFARINPEHKLRVVNVFKEMGYIVAVTGDGVNDAPALKRADIGVAMGLRGTDVAKESADMILLDDNFASIVAAIEEGRSVFDNIKKFITYIFAHLVPEAVPFVFYALLKIPVPITAMQILAIDLGTETIPALALGIEKPEPGIMKLPPRPREKGIIDKTVLFRGYIFLGLLNSVAVLAAYFLILYKGGWKFGVQLEPNDTTFANPLHLKAMTMIFLGIVIMQIANVFACRSDRHSAFTIGFFTNKLILWGIAFELLFIAALIYVPFFQKIFNTIGVGWRDWGLLFIFMVFIFILEEIRKRWVAKKLIS